MASKIPMVVSRLSNAPKVLLRQKTAHSMSTLEPRVKVKMERFGIDDGTPVFKKSGVFDSATYQMTMGFCAASLGLIFFNLGRMAFKK